MKGVGVRGMEMRDERQGKRKRGITTACFPSLSHNSFIGRFSPYFLRARRS